MLKTNSKPFAHLTSSQVAVLLISILIVALCGIVYELIIGAVSSYLLGNSIYQFSLTIGFFMFAMGAGSYLSKFLNSRLLDNFIKVEIAISIIGGLCSLLLFIVFPSIRALYEPVMYSLIFIIGALVGLEIPILMTILSDKITTKDAIANVMSLDYVGALIGSVAFPLLLLPTLGLIRSSFAIGLINILTAMVNIFYFKDELKHPNRLKVVAFIILTCLISLTFFGSYLTRFAEQHLYFDEIIYQQQTPYQQLTLTRSAVNREQRLYIDGHIQFSSRDEYRYHEALVHPAMSIAENKKHILILGGGDGLAAREILKYTEVESIEVVDIDPAITDMAQEVSFLRQLNHDSLRHPKITVINADAFSFINQRGQLYDVVIIDMPDPHNEAINKLYSKEFYTMIKRRMHPSGIIVTQSSSPFFTRRTFWTIASTLHYVFPYLQNYQIAIPSFGIWGFNLARSSAPLPTVYKFNIATRFLTAENMQAALIFGKDIAKIPTAINSVLEPKLYKAYLTDLSQ